MSTSNAPKPRFPKTVSGTCSWINRGCGVLKINRTLYTVVCLPVQRFRLLNWKTGDVYDIDCARQSCTCPSFVWDHCPVQAGGDGRCKHIAALRRLGFLPEPQNLSKSA
jgi:hypothetical protein